MSSHHIPTQIRVGEEMSEATQPKLLRTSWRGTLDFYLETRKIALKHSRIVVCFTVANYPVTVKLRCCFLATKYLHQVSRDPHCSLMKTFFWLNLELWCGKILDGNLNYTAISENDNIDPSLQRRAVAQQFLSISINTFFWNSYSTTQKMTCLESQEFLRLFFLLFRLLFCAAERANLCQAGSPAMGQLQNCLCPRWWSMSPQR